MLEIVINKIISSNYDGWDIHLLENHTLFNYLIEDNNTDKYSNCKLINSFLSNLKEFEIKIQINISKYFLLSIYDFSSDEIKNIIKNYIMNLDTQNFEIYDLIEFQLLLLTRDIIKIDDFDFKNKILKYIEHYKDGKGSLRFVFQLNDILKYLVIKKEIKQLKEIQEKVVEIINRHESLKLW